VIVSFLNTLPYLLLEMHKHVYNKQHIKLNTILFVSRLQGHFGHKSRHPESQAVVLFGENLVQLLRINTS
jgi:hypothetical protein